LLIANGLLAPVLIFQLAWPELIWIGAQWIPVFAAAMLLLARELGRRGADNGEVPPGARS
jgi:hypothetical protein